MHKKRYSIIEIFSVSLLLAAVLFGCAPGGEPDRLGSWGQIKQSVTRGPQWRKIVTDSPFQLGKKSVRGTWQTPDGPQDYYEIEFGTYPSIDGSTVAVPMAVEFARQHLRFSDEDANDFAAFSTTHEAYMNLIYKSANGIRMGRSEAIFSDEKHPVDLVLATEPSDEEQGLVDLNNVTLVKKPVCYDAFVFITHKDNPVDSLTVEQIKAIYSGGITNWKEVNGKNIPIAAYQREENSGSQTAMLNLVMKGAPMLPPEKVKAAMGMGMLIDAVAEYKNNGASIGYTYKFYIDTLYKNENIKILKVNDIYPDENNLRTGAYPFTTCYYGVIRSEAENQIGGRFLDWMLSEEGQRCIKQAGYIPYTDY